MADPRTVNDVTEAPKKVALDQAKQGVLRAPGPPVVDGPLPEFVPCQVDWGKDQSLIDELMAAKRVEVFLNTYTLTFVKQGDLGVHFESEVEDRFTINSCVLERLEGQGVPPAIRGAAAAIKGEFAREEDFAKELSRVFAGLREGTEDERAGWRAAILRDANVGRQCQRIRKRIAHLMDALERESRPRAVGIETPAGTAERRFLYREKKDETSGSFDVGLEFVGDLDQRRVPEALRKRFAESGSPLADPVTVTVTRPGQEWQVVGDRPEARAALRPFQVRVEGRRLLVVSLPAFPRVEYTVEDADEPDVEYRASKTGRDVVQLQERARGEIQRFIDVFEKSIRRYRDQQRDLLAQARALEEFQGPESTERRGRRLDLTRDLRAEAKEAGANADLLQAWLATALPVFRKMQAWTGTWRPEPVVAGHLTLPNEVDQYFNPLRPPDDGGSHVELPADVADHLPGGTDQPDRCVLPELRIHFITDRPSPRDTHPDPAAVLVRPQELEGALASLSDLGRRTLVPLKISFEGHADRSFRGGADDRRPYNQALSERRAAFIHDRIAERIEEHFRITDQALGTLRGAGLPPCVLEQLECIKGRVYAADPALVELILGATIGGPATARHRDAIMKAAIGRGFTEVAAPEGRGDREASGPADNEQDRYVRISIRKA